MSSRRLISVFAVLFLVQLLRFSPSDLEFVHVKDDDVTNYHKERMIRNRREDLPTSSRKSVGDEMYVFAPLIIGAGQGTTGTHLFVNATCAIGFVSLHYGIGCLPKHVLNMTIIGNSENKEPVAIPLQLLPPYEYYRTLLQRHTRITSLFLKAFKRNITDPLKHKDSVLTDLEEIIIWGKHYKVGLALHDTPYPMLIPEILKLVQKHYKSEEDKIAKPIILLSERDPDEYVERRIQSHGSYSWICRPSNVSTLIEKINPKTFEGGAFDFAGCISSSSSNLKMNEIFYTMDQARKINQRQFLVDSFKEYQDTMKDAAIFTYNMFNRANKTQTSELASMIRMSMSRSSLDERLNEGRDFAGFKELLDDGKIDYEQNPKALANILVFKNEVVL
jgi:hypothetical protein